MFERAAQVNANFPGGSNRQVEVVAALRSLGLEAGQITVIERAAPLTRPVAAPGWFARLTGRPGAVPSAAPPPPDVHILVHLGQGDALAEAVQEVFHRFGATQVNNYSSGKVPVHAFVVDPPSPDASVAPPLPGEGRPAATADAPESGERA
jgi:hypothetical protein